MKSSGRSTLKNGNPISPGRNEVNKFRKHLQRIGEENCLSLYELHIDIAKNADKIENRISSQQFLLDKVLPKALPARHVEIPLPSMMTLEGIVESEEIIMQQIAEGKMSLEEGEKLFSMTAERKKTYELSELNKMMQDIDMRLKDNGM